MAIVDSPANIPPTHSPDVDSGNLSESNTPIRKILSTYRVQLNENFTFADLIAVIPYLENLGVSHIYLSPILTATPGSEHGYDVIDPTSISDVLGGKDGFRSLVATAHAHNLGIVVDIVPNHMGIANYRANDWWWDVLTHGKKSPYYNYFDIDTARDNLSHGKIALPVLGANDDIANICYDTIKDPDTSDNDREQILRFYEHIFPIGESSAISDSAQGDDGAISDSAQGDDGTISDSPPDQEITETLAQQIYELVPWDSGKIGYRRFFAVNELIGLRQELNHVFEHTHQEIISWCTDGLVDGLRVDHIDGLAKPCEYITTLRTAIGTDKWLIVEKILTENEILDPTLNLSGTTGYEALRSISNILVYPPGANDLVEFYNTITGTSFTPSSYHESIIAAKREKIRQLFPAELARLRRTICTESIVNAQISSEPHQPDDHRTDIRCDHDTDLHTRIEFILQEIIAYTPYYRADYPILKEKFATIMGELSAKYPDYHHEFAIITHSLSYGEYSAIRLAQISGATIAKAIEDYLFYRIAPLVSLQEVGGDPAHMYDTLTKFHSWNKARNDTLPHTMTTLSTHDTKRGEDVRARITTLTQFSREWQQFITPHIIVPPSQDSSDAVDIITQLFLWQNIIGIWPSDGIVTDQFHARLNAYATKAIREAELHTSWTAINSAYEDAVHKWIDTILSPPIATQITQFVAQILPISRHESIAQKFIQLLAPGVPDIYQGTEVWEDSLVDPDNRRPVNYSLPHDGHPKFEMVTAALTTRKNFPTTFVSGDYVPLIVTGPGAEHIIAFARGLNLTQGGVIAITYRFARTFTQAITDDTTIALPPGSWQQIFPTTTKTYHDTVCAKELFQDAHAVILGLAST